MKTAKDKSNNEWLDSSTSYERTAKNEPINRLPKMERWQLKQTLEKMCHYAIFLSIFIAVYDVLSEYEIIAGDSKRWLKLLPVMTLIAGLLEIGIFVKFKKYFASLNSVIKQLIVFLALLLSFNVFIDAVENDEFLLITAGLLAVIILVYYLIIGVKIKRRYKDNSYLGTVFLISPILLVLVFIEEYWVATLIDVFYSILSYSAIGKSIKEENPVLAGLNDTE